MGQQKTKEKMPNFGLCECSKLKYYCTFPFLIFRKIYLFGRKQLFYQNEANLELLQPKN